MIFLDANINSQVDSARVVEADLGTPGRKMMVFSGIACPGWTVDDDDNTARNDVTVNLRKSVLAIEQAMVAVGLASFGNDDSTFLIATDTAVVDIDPSSQESLRGVIKSLRYCGVEPYIVLGEDEYREIAALENTKVLEDRVRFNPRFVQRNTKSPRIKRLMEKLDQVWG